VSTPPVRHAARELRHRVLRNVMLCLLACVLFVTTGAWAAYHNLQGKIGVKPIDTIIGGDRPDMADIAKMLD